MGVVYRARHVQLGKLRALKLLPPRLAKDESFRERFEREWRLAAAIEHPNIVEVLDAGEAEGRLYILMRLIDGPDLASLIRKEGPLASARAVAIVEQVASALDAAHAEGLIHRDVTPRNVLVADGDHAYLADFGVARAVTTAGLTTTGYFIGNLDYAPPEQIEGKVIDGRADVYALGGVLFTCLTGRSPYERNSDVELMYAQLNEPPPVPSRVLTGLPVALDGVVARAMAKAPEDRYGSAGELVEAARAALGPASGATVREGGLLAPTVIEAGAVAAAGGDLAPLRIFINYRRGDSSGYAGRLYDALSTRADTWRVFMDIDAIEPGADFVEVIDQALDECDVVIAVIGHQWIDATDARGRRRLDDPGDFVRLELANALKRGLRVIPTLVQGTEMPDAEEFPEELAPLARRHALDLSDGRWRYDIDRLVQLLEQIQRQATEKRAAEAEERTRREQQRTERAAKAAAARRAAELEAARKAEAAEAAKREAAEKEAAEREAAENEAAEKDATEVPAMVAATTLESDPEQTTLRAIPSRRRSTTRQRTRRRRLPWRRTHASGKR